MKKKNTPPPMDPRSILEPSPFSQYSAHDSSYTMQYNHSQLQANFFFCNSQSNGTEVRAISPGSLHYPRYHESDCSSIPRQVQSMPNYQLPHPHTHIPLEDLSHAHAQVPASSFGDHPPNDVHDIHTAPAIPWGNANSPMELYNSLSPSQNIPRANSSDLLGSSSTMTADDFYSLCPESYTPPEVQDDYVDAISSSGEARSPTSSESVETQGQDASGQEASQQGQRPSTKKEKDKHRKRVQRSEDVEHFTKICTLLKIPPGPKKTLAYRILIGVEALVKRQEDDSGLRHRLEESEAEVAALREDLARVSSERINSEAAV